MGKKRDPWGLLLLAILLAAGCGGRTSRENHRLRREAIELSAEIDRLKENNTQLEAELRRVTASDEMLPREVRTNVPHVMGIGIDRHSHVRLGEDRTILTLYILPIDGRGRFVQMVGDLSAHAAVLPGDSDAVTIGRVSLSPTQLRESYRASFMGTHYTITVPLDLEGIDADEFTAQVEFLDGLTGDRHVAKRSIKLQR